MSARKIFLELACNSVLFKFVSFCVAIFIFDTACGYGEEDVLGAWAYENDASQPRVVVDHQQGWLNLDGKWRPAQFAGTMQHGTGLSLDGEDLGVRWLLWYPEKLLCERFCAEGFAVDTNTVVLAKEKRIGVSHRWKTVEKRRMVKVDKPDWKRVRGDANYIGYWRLDNGSIFRIREDGLVVYKLDKPRISNGNEIFDVKSWRYDCAGIKILETKYLDEKDWRAIPRYGMWVDNSADHAVVFDSYKGHRATRTDEVFEDPVDKRLNMQKEGKYHGVWGVNSEFDIFVLAFDRCGKGILFMFMAQIPFEWTADSSGTIRCRFDQNVLEKMDQKGEIPRILECRYDARQNKMVVGAVFVSQERSRGRELPFMNIEPHIADILTQGDVP